MLLNNMAVDELLPQRSPMLMIDKILAMEDGKLSALPLHPLHGAPLWVLLESMGQTAQLLWSLLGRRGHYYIIKIDGFRLETSDIPSSGTRIEAEKVTCGGNLYKAKVKLLAGDAVLASALMTHYLKP